MTIHYFMRDQLFEVLLKIRQPFAVPNIQRPIIRLTRLGAGAGLALSLAACSSLIGGGDGISVSRTGQGAGAAAVTQAVPAGTDPEDVVIGRREHPKIVAAYGGIYQDRPAEIMLAGLAGRLMRAAGEENGRLTVTILDTPDVNAFALPGGYIYVTRGILALSNDEAELAAVLAHELAHVILKHARARTDRMRTSAIVDRVISTVLGGNVQTDQTVARSQVDMAAFSQAQELAADKEGIVIAARAGYDPNAAARFLSAMGRFARLSGDGNSQADDFLSSHPSTPDRIAKAVAISEGYAANKNYRLAHDSYLDAINGMEFGDNPDKGTVVGRQFIDPEAGFTFTVPKSYTLQNTNAAVVGVAGEGEAVRFDSAEVPKAMSLADYLRSGWIAGLDGGTVKSYSQNGIEMASAKAVTDAWTFHITAVRFKGAVYRFIFAARSDSAQFSQVAEQVAKSFRPTRESDLELVRHLQVRVATAKQGDTIASMAARMSGVKNSEQLFLVLNALYAGDPIVAGQRYKIVQTD